MSVLSAAQNRRPTFMENWLAQGITRTPQSGASFPSSSSVSSARISWEQMYICWTSLPRRAPTTARLFLSGFPKCQPFTDRGWR